MHSRNTILRILAVALVIMAPLLAQRDVDGSHWTRWEPARRLAYLTGFYAGLKADRAVFDQAERGQDRSQPGISDPLVTGLYKLERTEYYSREIRYDFKMMARLIDVFYTDPDNLGIPLPDALRIVMLRSSKAVQRADYLLMMARRKALEGR